MEDFQVPNCIKKKKKQTKRLKVIKSHVDE